MFLIGKKVAARLMLRVGIRPLTLVGQTRARHSNKHFDTMDTIQDPRDYFAKALRTELEHGKANRGTNVTDDDLDKTAQIVAAHLFGVEHGIPRLKWHWFPAYYDALWHMEETIPRKL